MSKVSKSSTSTRSFISEPPKPIISRSHSPCDDLTDDGQSTSSNEEVAQPRSKQSRKMEPTDATDAEIEQFAVDSFLSAERRRKNRRPGKLHSNRRRPSRSRSRRRR